jgi:hypothetical protein
VIYALIGAAGLTVILRTIRGGPGGDDAASGDGEA